LEGIILSSLFQHVKKLKRQSNAYILFFFMALIPFFSPTVASADSGFIPGVYGEFLPGALTPSQSGVSPDLGWGIGGNEDGFLNDTFFVRFSATLENYPSPGIFLVPLTFGPGLRLIKSDPGDFYVIGTIGIAPVFFPQGGELLPLYGGGIGYSFSRFFAEARVNVFPQSHFLGGSLIEFPLTIGMHL
jgi:hypothetical protein